MASIMEGEHKLPARRWHATGYQISIVSSLVMAACIGVFFSGIPGWSPTESLQQLADFSVTWILLTYIWVQMGSLILVGAGTKNQMWLDALTSMLPLFLLLSVILQHHSDSVVLSSFQAKAAWVTAYTLGVTVLLSGQVVEVGGGGVG